MKRVAFIAAAVVLLGGCTKSVKYDAHAVAGEGSEKAGMATVVVAQRQKDGFGAAWWQNVDIDGKKVGDIRRGTYLHVNVAPGHHIVDVSYPAMMMASPPLGLEGDFEADKTYYFVWDAAGDGLKEKLQIQAVSPSVGRASIAGMTDRTAVVTSQH
ncbi:hypothetical protein ABIE56_003161 [Luteibacter sp. 621]|uniref:hypothetical protein n=1 Tax=Luteibacter sp. 621 TaxID=3373916 RepID=UPI003D222ED2